MVSAASELPLVPDLSEPNEEELRLLLEQLGTPQGFALSLAWVPDEATSRAVIQALCSRLPQLPKVIDARAWPKDEPFLHWLLDQADGDCADGRVCIVAGLGGVEIARHPLRHLNTNRNHWMRAAPCHWVLLLPPYAQLRATAEAAGLPRFALGEEMPDVYSIRAGDYVFDAEPGLASMPESRAELDWQGPRFTREEVEKALEFLRQLEPGEGPEAAALYARALVNELEPFVEYRSLATIPSTRKLFERVPLDELSPALCGRVLALWAVLAEQWRDPKRAPTLTEAALDRLESALARDEIGAGMLTTIAVGLNTLSKADPNGSDQRLCAVFARAIEACERIYGPDHPVLAQTLNGMGVLHSKQARYWSAEPPLRRALAIRERVLEPNPPEVAVSLNNLAATLHCQGKYADAELLYRRALAIQERALGPDHPNTASTLDNLASDLGEQGNYAEAEPLFRRSLAIREQALGPDHPDVATSLNNLAVDLEIQGKYAEAEPFYCRALAIRERTLGPQHPDVAMSLNNLARILDRKGRVEEAEQLYRRALATAEAALGKDHPEVRSYRHNLARLWLRM